MKGGIVANIVLGLLAVGAGYVAIERDGEVRDLKKTNIEMQERLNAISGTHIGKSPKTIEVIGDSHNGEPIIEKEEIEQDQSESEAVMTVSFDSWVQERSIDKASKPTVLGNKEGIVMLDVVINRIGHVTRARWNRGSTITDEKVVEDAKEAALHTTFTSSDSAPDLQSGTIRYTYTQE